MPAEDSFSTPKPSTIALLRSHGYVAISTLRHRVPWGDQDSYGHVNNAQYLRYFETGRINYFDMFGRTSGGFPLDFMAPGGIGPVLRKTDIDFKSQLVRNDVIAIQYKTTHIGTTSIQLEGIIIHEERQEVVCTAKEVLVMYDFVKREKAVIPSDWRSSFSIQRAAELLHKHAWDKDNK